MRPILIIGEVLASRNGPLGTGAVIARELAEKTDHPVVLASRVGDGEVGRSLVQELEAAGVDCSVMQYDYDRPTLRANAIRRDPARPNAHDLLQWDSDLERNALKAGLVICTIGIRHSGQSRSTADRALLAAEGTPRVILLMQDEKVFEPIERDTIGRACELSEILVAGPEAFAALRVHPPMNARDVAEREDIDAVLLSDGDTTDIHGPEVSLKEAGNEPLMTRTINLLAELAKGSSISDALRATD